MTGPGRTAALLPLTGRGGLPFETLHGEPLYLHALRALAAVVAAPTVVVEAKVGERVEREVRRTAVAARVVTEPPPHAGGSLLVHDPLCPLTPPAFLAEALALAAGGASVAAFRPVTDTVKTAADGRIVGTIDREQLAAVLSPVVLAPSVLADGAAPPTDDLAELVGWARARGRVELLTAPAMARRVDDVSSVNLLECLDELGRQVRH